MILDVIILPYFVLFPGLLGGLAGGGIGWFIKIDTLRWTIFFTFLGMLNGGVLYGLHRSREIVVHSADVQIFIPLFALLGAISGFLYKKTTGRNEWSWIGVFTFFGALLGAVSQLRGTIIWLIVLSLIMGTVVWYDKNSRVIWSIVLSGFGALVSWSLFASVPAFSDDGMHIIIGISSGALLGWFTSDNTRWLLAFIMLGTFVGGMIEWISFWEATYLLIGGIFGGAVGYMLRVVSLRKLVALIYFSFFLTSFTRLNWLVFQAMDRFF